MSDINKLMNELGEYSVEHTDEVMTALSLFVQSDGKQNMMDSLNDVTVVDKIKARAIVREVGYSDSLQIVKEIYKSICDTLIPGQGRYAKMYVIIVMGVIEGTIDPAMVDLIVTKFDELDRIYREINDKQSGVGTDMTQLILSVIKDNSPVED